MVWLRLGILSLLIAAWINPSLPIAKSTVDFIVVIDDSASMQHKLTEQVWADIGQSVSTLQAGSRLAIVRFGKNAVLELPFTAIDSKAVKQLFEHPLPPQNKTLNIAATNLQQALEFTRDLIEPERESHVFILHDAQQTEGNADAILRKLSKQIEHVFQLDLSGLAKPDAWVASLNAPLNMNQQQLIPVAVTLGSNHTTEGELGLWVNKKLVQQQIVQLKANQLTSVHFDIAACLLEICQIKVSLLVDEDAIQQNNQRETVVSISQNKPILYLHNKLKQPPFLHSLLSSKLVVDSIKPDLCLSSVAALLPYQVIVLDDIAINELSAACWNAIDNSVRKQGIGLIVLGGRQSYSAGAYRHSLLEGLLPVTAEAAQFDKGSTLLFLVDKSGSMDNDSSGYSRIAMARQAMIETLVSQPANDAVGVISFDVEPHLLMPIQLYDNSAQVIKQRFNPAPAGGTKLKPALTFALTELDKQKTESSTLVLVTDGYLDALDYLNLSTVMQEKKITLIVMAIGQHEKTQSLKQLAEANGGTFLQVNKVAELPMLMRKEIEQRRTPIETRRTKVKQVHDLPFVKTTLAWPDLTAYNVSKTKPGSTVYLGSNKGDPLWAMHYAGAGKVVALPAGLGAWANNWLQWNKWGMISQGLIEMAASHSQHPFMHLNLHMHNRLQLDARTSSLAWLNSSAAQLFILDPQQQLEKRSFPLVAAGQYEDTFATEQRGIYKISVKVAEYNAFFHLFSNDVEEYLPAKRLASVMQDSDLVSPVVVEGIIAGLKTKSGLKQVQVRSMALLSALLLYVLLILIENNFIIKVVSSEKKRF